MNEEKGTLFNPAAVTGTAYVAASKEDIGLALDAMIDKKKIKHYYADETKIEMQFKMNWWSFARKMETLFSFVHFESEYISPTETQLHYRFRMQSAKVTRIYGFVAGAILILFSLILFALLRFDELGLIAGGFYFVFGWLMIGLPFIAWTKKRQTRYFNKYAIERLEKMLKIIQDQRNQTI